MAGQAIKDIQEQLLGRLLSVITDDPRVRKDAHILFSMSLTSSAKSSSFAASGALKQAGDNIF
jgi:hypothetical protein